MYTEMRKRSKKVGLLPGVPVYTGNKKNVVPKVTVIIFNDNDYYEKSGDDFDKCMPATIADTATTWINVEGLHNVTLIEQIAKRYNLHPLTTEDILNVEQRCKIEEFDHYIFLTLKILHWNDAKNTFVVSDLSLILSSKVVISFHEQESALFSEIRDRIKANPQLALRKQSSDYLFYRLIDLVVDQYFLVLEGLGDQIEKVEDSIISNPNKQSARSLYRLKRQVLMIRKVIWPMREVTSHLLKINGELISSFTYVYFRDVYDHTVQAIDTVETFREMLSNMLDVYLSSLTNKMNEVMKVLTIIATTFIPVTFLASIYGMNFDYMPELQYKWGFAIVIGVMLASMTSMLIYFKIKKWW